MGFLAFEGKSQVQEYVYDFDVDAGAQGEIVLSNKSGYDPIPVGAIIKDIVMYVETAMTSEGSATLAVGDGDDDNGWIEATAMDTWSANGVCRLGEYVGALGWDDSNDHLLAKYVVNALDGQFSILIETADLTAGKLRFYVEYLMTRTNTR